MPVNVKRATLDDIDGVAPLFDAYRQFYDRPPDLAGARQFLEDRTRRDESVILIALPEASRDVAGFTQLYRAFSSVSLGGTIVLNDLFVVPAWRGQGLARRLVEAAIAHARDVEALRVELATAHTNRNARRLYDSMGFRAETEFLHLSLELR